MAGGMGGPPELVLFFSPPDKGGEGESGLGVLTTYMGEACAVAHQPGAPPHPVCFSRWCQRTRARLSRSTRQPRFSLWFLVFASSPEKASSAFPQQQWKEAQGLNKSLMSREGTSGHPLNGLLVFVNVQMSIQKQTVSSNRENHTLLKYHKNTICTKY